MKKIAQGNNPHVVNMIGCVTLQEPLCLLTEFIKYGDLLSYLRSSRKMAICVDREDPYPDLKQLESSDLLSFAYQIASGMVRYWTDDCCTFLVVGIFGKSGDSAS